MDKNGLVDSVQQMPENIFNGLGMVFLIVIGVVVVFHLFSAWNRAQQAKADAKHRQWQERQRKNRGW